MPDIKHTIDKITANEIAYAPAVLAGVQAAETAGGSGHDKLNAVVNGIIAGSQTLESAPSPTVAGIAALVNLTVSILNALGIFKKKAVAASGGV